MDRTLKRKYHHRATVRTVGTVSLEPVLPGKGAQRAESDADAIDRPAIYETTVLRLAQNYRLAAQARAPGESQASRTVDEGDGASGDLPETSTVTASSRTSNLSILATQCADSTTQPGLEYRHHIHPTSGRIPLFGSNYGLVQSLCTGVGSINNAGYELLRFSVGMGACQRRSAGDLQHRSRRAVHQYPVHRKTHQSFDTGQHGWKRSCSGQCVCRTPLALSQVRRGLFERLPGRGNSRAKAQGLFRILQPGAAASVPWLFNAGSCLLQAALRTGFNARGTSSYRSNESMSFLRHTEPHQSDERVCERARPMATPSLILLMSLRLVIPGGLLSSIARFRFTNRRESPTKRDRLQLGSGGEAKQQYGGCYAAPIHRARFTTLAKAIFCPKNGGRLRLDMRDPPTSLVGFQKTMGRSIPV